MDFIDSITPAYERVDLDTPVERRFSGEWRCRALSEGRIYFVNVEARTSQWLPPPELWNSKFGLPYGWEVGIDDQSLRYYINHVNGTTTREDPRSEADQATHLQSMTQPKARKIEIVRDEIIGYGFVAGSERPVVIRSVIPNGPSHEILFANDQILKVNGQDVRDVPQNDVINLIKSCTGRLNMEVVATEDIQDVKNKHHRKSSLMSRTTRERRRSSPVNVRFAEEPTLVHYIGPQEEEMRRSSVPLMPNVLKVFLENGQTRSFRYTTDTLVEEILTSLAEKLAIKAIENFGLVLGGPLLGQVSYVNNHEKVSEIYSSRNLSSVNWLCRLQICFVPKEPYKLLKKDPNAFEYLYAQITNNVVDGLYGADLKFEVTIKLAALHIQQVATEDANGKTVKISVKNIDKDYGGMQRFVPADVLNHSKEKRLRKAVSQQIKQNLTLAAPGQKHMNALQCKWHYLNIACDVFSYGGKYFNVLLVNSEEKQDDLEKQIKQEATILVGPRHGISHVVNAKVHVFCELAKLDQMTRIVVAHYNEGKRRISVGLTEGKEVTIISSAMDCLDIIALATGYYQLYFGKTLPVKSDGILQIPVDVLNSPCEEAPPYKANHRVLPDSWSYPIYYMSEEEQQFKKWLSSPDGVYNKLANGNFRIDFSKEPPAADVGYSSEVLNILGSDNIGKPDIVAVSERAQQYLVKQSLGNAKQDHSVVDGDVVDMDKITSPTLSQASPLYEIPEEDDWSHTNEDGPTNKENKRGEENKNSIFNLLMAEHQWMNKIMDNSDGRPSLMEEEEDGMVKGHEDGSQMAARRAKLHLDLPSVASSFPDHGGDKPMADKDAELKIKRTGTLSRYLIPSSQGAIPDADDQDQSDTQSISSTSDSANSSENRDEIAKDRMGAVRLRNTAEDSVSTWSWSSDEQEGDEVFVIHQDELPREDDSMLPEIFLQPSMSFSRYSRNLSNLTVPQPSVVGSMMSLAQFEMYPEETEETSSAGNNEEKNVNEQISEELHGKEHKANIREENSDIDLTSNTSGNMSRDVEPVITIEQIRRLRERKRLESSESAGTARSESVESYMELMLGEARLAQAQRRRKPGENEENESQVFPSENDNNVKIIINSPRSEPETGNFDTRNLQISEANDETDGTSNGIVSNFDTGAEKVLQGTIATENANKSPFNSYLASRFSPSQWIVPKPPSETEAIDDLHVVSPPPSEFQEIKFDESILSKLKNDPSESEVNIIDATLSQHQHAKEFLSDAVELGHNLDDREIEELIVPPPPTVTDPLLQVLIASPPSAFLDALDAPEEPGISTGTETIDHSQSAISRELQRIKTLSLGERGKLLQDNAVNDKSSNILRSRGSENESPKHRTPFGIDIPTDRPPSSVASVDSENEVFHGISGSAMRSRKSKPSPPARRSSLGFPKTSDSYPVDGADMADSSSFNNMASEEAIDELSAASVTAADRQRCCDIANVAVASSSDMKNRLEKCLGCLSQVDSSNHPDQESRDPENWQLSMQNHARFLACDVKVIFSGIRGNHGEIAPALETSLASLRKLVSYCEIAFSSRNFNSKHNLKSLVHMTIAIVTLYSDVIVFTKAIIEKTMEKPYKELLSCKAEALVNHLASLITELRTFQPTEFTNV